MNQVVHEELSEEFREIDRLLAMKRERARENSSIPPTMEHDGHMLDIDKLIDALLEADREDVESSKTRNH